MEFQSGMQLKLLMTHQDQRPTSLLHQISDIVLKVIEQKNVTQFTSLHKCL